MTQTPQSALRQAELYSDGQDYRLLTLPVGGMTLAAGVVAEAALPFSAMVADKDEVTLVIQDEACAAFSRRLRRARISEQAYRLITFDTPLEPNLVGFLAYVCRALAGAEIPILAFAAFSRDHLLVPAEHIEGAMVTLKKLQREND